MKIEILEPFGYCAGVDHAIQLALQTKKEHPHQKIVVLGMLVHNEDALNELSKAGIETLSNQNCSLIDLIDKVEVGSIVILTAHGHSHDVEEKLVQKGITFVDATCPFVTLTFKQIQKTINEGRDVLYLGKKNHPEANAALSISKNVHLIDPKSVQIHEKYSHPLVISQTTFSESEIANAICELKLKVQDAEIIPSICQASTLRQSALKNLSKDVELIYVVGGKNSNNTKTLFEIASLSHPNAKVMMIQNASDINKKDRIGLNYIAISSGASTPKQITNEIKHQIKLLMN